MKNKCLTCYKKFIIKINTKGKFCSYACYWKSLKGKGTSPRTQFQKGQQPWNLGMAKKYECKTCEKSFKNKSHGMPKYCSEECKKNGEWGKVMGSWNKGRPAWNRGKPAPWANWKILMRKDIRKKALQNSYKARFPKKRMSYLEEKMEDIIIRHNLSYKFVGDGKFFIEGKNPDFINTNGEKKAIDVFYRRHKEYTLQKRGKSFDAWYKDRKKVFEKYGWNLLMLDYEKIRGENEIVNFLQKGGVDYDSNTHKDLG